MTNKLNDYMLFTLPILYSIYLFYIRVVISRAPRDITIIDSNYKLYLLVFIILCFTIRIYALLKILDILPTKEAKNIVILNMKISLSAINHYLTLLKSNFIRDLANKVKYFMDFSLWLIQMSYKYIKTKRFAVILFICEIGTKLIVLLVFLIEVFYFKQLTYFYKFLALLLIPLITDFLISIMCVFYNDNLGPVIGFLDSKPIQGTEYDEFCFYDNNQVPSFVSDLDDFVENHLSPIFDFVYTLSNINAYRIKYKFKHILLFVNLCYFVSWTYVLFVGLGIINN